MKCTSPRLAWYSRARNENGKRQLVFSVKDALPDSQMFIGCGKCVPCRMKVTGDWSVRIIHETWMYPRSCCATLTFDDGHVPDSIEDMRPIVKAFKKRCERKSVDTRSHWLLEYGGKFDRPHAHVIFFREDFRDSSYFLKGKTTYGSQLLDDLWGMGFVHLDALSPAASRYCCGHNTGKLLVNPVRDDGGKSFFFIPARRPAVGMTFARQFASDIKAINASVISGKLTAVPGAYLKNEPELFGSVIEHNRDYAKQNSVSVPITMAESERLEALATTLLIQTKEIQAWHRGAH